MNTRAKSLIEKAKENRLPEYAAIGGLFGICCTLGYMYHVNHGAAMTMIRVLDYMKETGEALVVDSVTGKMSLQKI